MPPQNMQQNNMYQNNMPPQNMMNPGMQPNNMYLNMPQQEMATNMSPRNVVQHTQ